MKTVFSPLVGTQDCYVFDGPAIDPPRRSAHRADLAKNGNEPHGGPDGLEMKMAGQQEAIYNSYVTSTTKNNVEPVTYKGDREVFEILRANGVDFDNPYSHTTRFWDNDSRTKVFKFDDGRIAEYATTNTAMGTSLLAVFETHDDWFSYRKPMGRFHYFHA